MGYLRKEKIELQKELEKLKKGSSSRVIRVEDLRKQPPLHILVKELQDKINKQESLLRKLENNKLEIEENYKKILEKKEEEIKDLKDKLENVKEISKSEYGEFDLGLPTSNLLEELQKKLNKLKRQNETLTKRINELEKHKIKNVDELQEENESLKSRIKFLEEELEKKSKEISTLQTSSNSSTMSEVLEELKSKLNKSKAQIQFLQEQLQKERQRNIQYQKSLKKGMKLEQGKTKYGENAIVNGELNQLREELKTKESELLTIKNEAINMKKKLEELQARLKFKDNRIIELEKRLESSFSTTIDLFKETGSEIPELKLKVQELKSLVDELTKQNIQQRIEIAQLRKSK